LSGKHCVNQEFTHWAELWRTSGAQWKEKVSNPQTMAKARVDDVFFRNA
jgi:hypothetical protein